MVTWGFPIVGMFWEAVHGQVGLAAGQRKIETAPYYIILCRTQYWYVVVIGNHTHCIQGMIASHSKAQIWFAYPPRAASRENTLLPWIASFLLHVGFKDSLRYLIHLARWFSKRNKRISIWRVFEMHLTHLTSADWGKCCAPLSPPKFLPMETYGNQLLIILQKWDAGMPQKWENHRCFNGKFIYIYIYTVIYTVYIYTYIYIYPSYKLL